MTKDSLFQFNEAVILQIGIVVNVLHVHKSLLISTHMV